MFTASPLLAKHGVQALFSDRDGCVSSSPFDSLNLGLGLGDSAANIEKNLNILISASAIPVPHQTQQVHTTKVFHCSGKGQMHEIEADVLISNQIGTSLAVRTADCLPILIADSKAGIVAAVHAGWRGSVARVAEVAVKAMLDLGARRQDMMASLGPCIGDCCFEINTDIAMQLAQSCGEDVITQREGVIYANLAKTNELQLIQAGLAAGNIETLGICTVCCHSPSYFSYRRDHGQTGRQLSIIHLA